MLLFPFRKLVQVDPWNSSVGVHPGTAAAPQSYMRATWVTLHATISSQDTLPTELTRSFIWLQAREAKDSYSLSRSSIIILTRAILTMAEVPFFQNGWTATRVPQLAPHGSVVDKLSIFSASRYAGLVCLRVMLLLPTARALICSWLPNPIPIADP